MKQRCRVRSIIPLTSLFLILVALDGCSSKPVSSGVHFPITSGSHTRLPAEQQRILIWGEPYMTRVAEEWLRSHHYAHILITPQSPHQLLDRQAALTLARDLDAELVLFLEREAPKEGALIESHCGLLFNIHIDVRGLLVETHETVLYGGAHYPQCVEHSGKIVQNLTCQALATAWGFRPSGQLAIPSHLACTAGQRGLPPNH